MAVESTKNPETKTGGPMSQREFRVADAPGYTLRSPLAWIRSHIARYPYLPFIMIFSMLIADISYSLAYMLVGQAFDIIGAPDSSSALFLRHALLIFGAFFLTGVFGIGGAFASEFLAQRTERDTREELYISLLGKSQTFHNRQRLGDIMARATNDVKQLNLMLNPGVALIIESAMAIVVPLAGMLVLHTDLLLVPVLFLVVFGGTLYRYNQELAPITVAQRMQFGTMNANLAEAISGIEVVKAYAQEEREYQRFTHEARRYRDLFVQEGQVKARYLPLLAYGVAYGLAIGHGAHLFLHGELSIGQVVAFMGLMGILQFPTFISLFSFSLVQLGLAGAERILSLIRAETELDENVEGVARPIEGQLTFDHVTFGYGGSEHVLHNVSFCAQPGETVAIVGQTGSGKTTLTRLVNRFYDVQGGRVLVDGDDVRDWSMQALRSQISAIEQDIFLFSRTIGENIAFGATGQVSREQIEQAARNAQAHDFIMRFPNGYDTMVGERGVTLSGGQRQRIAIARAFLTDPRILILDDSTSAIDSATEDQIQRAMRGILQGRTTLLITHRLSQIRWADRILVLRRGKLVAQGTHTELMEQSEIYRRIFARYD